MNSSKRTCITLAPGHSGVSEGAPILLFLFGNHASDRLSEFQEALKYIDPSGWVVGISDKLLINNRHPNCYHIWSRLENKCKY